VPPDAVCAPTEAAAHPWIDGELTPAEAAAFGRHLDACPPCRTHVAELWRFLAAVRRVAASAPAAPAPLRLRVRDLAARWHARDATAHEPVAATAAAVVPE
jgi:anti-sigma factor RsiW